VSRISKRARYSFFVFPLLVAMAIPATAKVKVDFDPEAPFASYKTFAYIGGVEKLVAMQVNPDLVSNRIHRGVTRELTQKGLREVQPNENPDLVVRYWANTSVNVDLAASGNFGAFGPYIGSYWGYTYFNMAASSHKKGSLLVDIIDTKTKDLAWRLYIVAKIMDVDKAWRKLDEDAKKGFQSFPPSEKEKADKRKERLEHKPTDAPGH
jgi:hypothetical protein